MLVLRLRRWHSIDSSLGENLEPAELSPVLQYVLCVDRDLVFDPDSLNHVQILIRYTWTGVYTDLCVWTMIFIL